MVENIRYWDISAFRFKWSRLCLKLEICLTATWGRRSQVCDAYIPQGWHALGRTSLWIWFCKQFQRSWHRLEDRELPVRNSDTMDIRWFLKQRLDFIRNHYDCSTSTFLSITRQIEGGEAPFDNPPYSEDGEPAFQIEWEDANTSIDLIGISCVSLLSDALKLYLNSLKKLEFRFEFCETEKKALKKG